MTSALVPDDGLGERLTLLDVSKRSDCEADGHVEAATDLEPRRTRFLRRRRGLPANALAITLPDGTDHLVTYEVAEQMRLLMARAKVERNLQCLAITSTVAGEGSSYVAKSLATVLAHDSGLHVCLVQFNWDEAGAEERANDIKIVGITADGREDTAKRITVVTSGEVAPLQRSLFATSDSLNDDIEAFRESFDVVILDLPAVASHTGVLSLSEYADRCLLVARQGAAPVAKVRAAMDDLGRDYLAGVVLNHADFDTPNWLMGITGS